MGGGFLLENKKEMSQLWIFPHEKNSQNTISQNWNIPIPIKWETKNLWNTKLHEKLKYNCKLDRRRQIYATLFVRLCDLVAPKVRILRAQFIWLHIIYSFYQMLNPPHTTISLLSLKLFWLKYLDYFRYLVSAAHCISQKASWDIVAVIGDHSIRLVFRYNLRPCIRLVFRYNWRP